jgi:hypothetical protein
MMEIGCSGDSVIVVNGRNVFGNDKEKKDMGGY